MYTLSQASEITGLSKSRIHIARCGLAPSKWVPRGLAPKLEVNKHWVIGEKGKVMYTKEGIKMLKTPLKRGRKPIREKVSLKKAPKSIKNASLRYPRMTEVDKQLLEKNPVLFSPQQVEKMLSIRKQATLSNLRYGIMSKKNNSYYLPLLKRGVDWIVIGERVEGSRIRYTEAGVEAIKNHLQKK